MSLRILISITVIILITACNGSESESSSSDSIPKASSIQFPSLPKALLTSRLRDLDHFKSIVNIQYYADNEPINAPSSASDRVVLSYFFGEDTLVSVLKKGISQDDIVEAKDGELIDKLTLLVAEPYAIKIREELKKVQLLARRRRDLFGWGDVAFYDLAEVAMYKIKDDSLSFQSKGDKGEKGYINTFNHITAQALISAIFSEKHADFIGDVHELHAMPELVNGMFTTKQITDFDNNPRDNYIDLIHNEIGQELGLYIKSKYDINSKTHWTKKLLVNCLNELQSYYAWSFRLDIEPFRENEEIIDLFCNKMNVVLNNSNY